MPSRENFLHSFAYYDPCSLQPNTTIQFWLTTLFLPSPSSLFKFECLKAPSATDRWRYWPCPLEESLFSCGARDVDPSETIKVGCLFLEELKMASSFPVRWADRRSPWLMLALESQQEWRTERSHVEGGKVQGGARLLTYLYSLGHWKFSVHKSIQVNFLKISSRKVSWYFFSWFTNWLLLGLGFLFPLHGSSLHAYDYSRSLFKFAKPRAPQLPCSHFTPRAWNPPTQEAAAAFPENEGLASHCWVTT